MKKINRQLAILLVMVQLFCLGAVAAGAEGGMNFGIKVGDTILETGVYYTSPDGRTLEKAESEPAQYIMVRIEDNAPHLVMKDFTIEVNTEGTQDPTYAGVYCPIPVVMDITGENRIMNKGYFSPDGMQKFSIGLNLNDQGAIITGDGSVAFLTNTESDYNGYGYGILTSQTILLRGDGLSVDASGATAAMQTMPMIDDNVRIQVNAGESESQSSSAWSFLPETYTQSRYVSMNVGEGSTVQEAYQAYVTGQQQSLLDDQQNQQEEFLAEQQAQIDAENARREEEARLAEEARIAEEQRQAEEAARLAEEQRQAEEAARLAEEQRQAEEAARKAEEQRQAEEAARKAEEQRQAEEAAQKAEEQRQAEEAARKAEEQRQAEEAARKAEEQRQAEEAARKAEEQRQAEEAARLAEEQRQAEEAARLAEEQRQAEEAARLAEEQRQAEEAAAAARQAEEAKKAEEVRLAEEARLKAEEEDRKRAEEEANQINLFSVTPEALEENKLMAVQPAAVAAEIEAFENQTTETAEAKVEEQFVTIIPETQLFSANQNGGENPSSALSEVKFEAETERSGRLSNVNTGMAYQIGYRIDGKDLWPADTEWIDIVGTSFEISGLQSGRLIRVKVKTEDNSTAKLFEITQQPQISEVATVSSTPVSGSGKTDGTITINTSSGNYIYQIRGKGSAAAFVDITGNQISGLRAGTYEVRIKAENKVQDDGKNICILASGEPYLEVTVGSYTAPVKLPTPTARFTATGESSGILTGVNATMQYALGSGAPWVPITGETTVIPSGVTGQILVRALGRESEHTADSDIQAIEIRQYSAPIPANVAVNNASVTVAYGTPMQIKRSSDGESGYVDITNKIVRNLPQGNYDVRFKADGNILASKPLTVSVTNIEARSLMMNPTSVTLTSTESSAKLAVAFNPLNTTNQTVYWTSSNENVVRIHDSYRTTYGTNGVAMASVIAVGAGTATVTARTANGLTASCSVTVQANYYFTYHKNGSWYYDVGGAYTVQATGPASRLVGTGAAVKINGKTINPYYYTVSAANDGTSIVTISETAMKAMEHRAYQTLQFVYSDGGVATCYLHILSVRDRPITGDESNVSLWACLMVLSAAAFAVTVRRRKEN